MNLELDLVQTSALALVLLLLGEVARHRIEFLRKYAFPGPVIGGFLFAIVVFALRQANIATLDFDSTLQTPAMIAFFSTVGLAGSFALLRQGGKLLLIYVVACWMLAIAQNLIGIGIANLLGVDPMMGIMAGSVSLEGGHGAAAAFGATAEEMGSAGAKTVAIAAATFGLVAGGMLGGPIASWLMRRHRIEVPAAAPAVPTIDADAVLTADGTMSVAESTETARYLALLRAGVVIGAIMALGALLDSWFSQVTGFALPAYVGAMVLAVAFRNLNDRFRIVDLDDHAVGLISQMTLGFFLTLAMMSLKIWDLAALALPLVVMLAIQVVFIIVFASEIVFRMLGRNYDAATMVGGMLGHGLGGTPNAMANMDAFNQRFGVRSSKAFLIVPLAGAVLIDLVGLPWIVFCMNWVG